MPLMLLRFEATFLIMYTVQHQMPPSGKAQNLPVCKKPVRYRPSHSPASPVSSGYVIGLTLIHPDMFSCCLESVN